MTKIQKGNIKLFFILMMMHQFLYFLPAYVGPLSDFNIMFLLGGAMVAYVFFKEKGYFAMGEYGYIILVIPVFIVLSAVGGYIHYDQPIISGLATQRLWLSTAWTYFAIMYLIRKEEITYDSFVQVLYAIVGVELVIYFTQYFLGEKYMFLNCGMNYRNGTIRLYCDINYMMLLALIATEQILRKRKIGVNLLYVAAIILYHLLVNKSRTAIIALFFAIGLVLLLSRNVSKRLKVAAIVLAGIGGLLFMANNTMIQDAFASVFLGKYDKNYTYRLDSQVFYLEKWTSTPFAFLFGYGYANSNIEASRIATGVTSNYLLADNGVFGFIFCYGLVGLIWYAWYLIKLFKCSIRAYKNQTSALLARNLAGLIMITLNCSFFYVHFSFDMIFLITLTELLNIESGKGALARFPERRRSTGV